MASPALPQDPAPPHGAWLRSQRQARDWNVAQMRTRLRLAASRNGDTLPGNDVLGVMIRQWEAGFSPVPLRYHSHYCRALSVSPDEFGTAPLLPGQR